MDVSKFDVIAPNLKRRLSGVTTTVVRLLPIQSGMIGIAATGPGLPVELPHISLMQAALMPRDRWRVWHARRNSEMLLGLLFKHVLRRRYCLLFTSAAQRDHSGYTKKLIRQMDRVVATSPQAASFLERNADVIMHGVDTSVFKPTPDISALRRKLGLPDGVLVGCFGRVRHQKGVDVLIDAALGFLGQRPEVHVVFTGRITKENEEFVDDLKTRLSNAGFGERVLFSGELDWETLVGYFQAMDLFVAPARWEGFGLTPLEAMACGVPVVATDVGAFRAQIVEGVTGHIVPPGDIASLEKAIVRFLDNPQARTEAGKNARNHVLEHFPIEREATSLVQVYKEMLKVKKP